MSEVRERGLDEGAIDSAYMELCGAILNMALSDYKDIRFGSKKTNGYTVKERKTIYYDAKEFIFSHRLDIFIESCGIGGIVRADKIRRAALEGFKGQEAA